MAEYLFPMLFLVILVVAFGLAFRNRGVRSCGDCDNDCDSSSCEKS